MRKITLLFPFLLAAAGLAGGCDRHAPAVDPDSGDAAMHDDEHGHTDHDHEEDEHADHDEHGHDEAGHEEGHTDEVKLSGEAMKRSGIRVEPARAQSLVGTITAPARVTFNAEGMAHVGSPLVGRVSEIRARVGDRVNKNDPLLIVQSPELGESQSDYLLKRMAAETAIPAVELARAAHERARALYEESQGIALAEVQKREVEFKAAQGNLLAARAQATAAENLLHLMGMDQSGVEALTSTGEIDPYYTLRAPISGQVIEREATLGELVNPDREALLVLADMSTLWVLADVPESQLSGVKIGARAQVTVPALGGRGLEGVVAFIAASLDPATRTAPVRIEVKGNGHGLLPGMFAQALIFETGDEGGHASVLAIPEEATQWVEGQTVVFVPVEDEENTFAKRPVVLGPAVGGVAPVLSGLEEGESFVVAGSFMLKAEMGKAGAEHVH